MEDSQDYNFAVSNEELLIRCAEQDQEALHTFFRRHERPVYNLLYRMLGNHEDSEEALADVFVKVWRSAGKFRGASKVTTWLYHVAANTARDRLRSRKAKAAEVAIEDMVMAEVDIARANPDGYVDPEKACLDSEQSAFLTAAINRLSEEDRLLITLYHLQEVGYEEISKITGISPSHLKVKLFRARRRLREHCLMLEKEETDNEMQRDTTEPNGLQPRAAEAIGD